METRRKRLWYPCRRGIMSAKAGLLAGRSWGLACLQLQLQTTEAIRRLQREYLQQLPAATFPRMITPEPATETFHVAREV